MKETIHLENKTENQFDTKKYNNLREKAKTDIIKIFNQFENGEQRIEEIKKQLGEIIQNIPENNDTINKKFEFSGTLQNPDDFAESIIEIIEPLLQIKIREPKRYEEILRENIIKRNQYETANQLVAYEIKGNEIELHILPNETTKLSDKKKLMIEGLKEIAKIVDKNKEIMHIAGVSWIARKHKKLMTSLKFNVQDFEEKVANQLTNTEPKDVALAYMDRNEFLKEYLK